jgi:hypothetical protein
VNRLYVFTVTFLSALRQCGASDWLPACKRGWAVRGVLLLAGGDRVLMVTSATQLSLPAAAGHSSNRNSQLVDSALTPGAGHVPTQGSAESNTAGEAKEGEGAAAAAAPAAAAAVGDAGGSSAAAQQLKQGLSGSSCGNKKLPQMQAR